MPKKKKQPMSPEVAAKGMEIIKENFGHDPEVAHTRADAVLVEILESIGGYNKALKIYTSMVKYYS